MMQNRFAAMLAIAFLVSGPIPLRAQIIEVWYDDAVNDIHQIEYAGQVIGETVGREFIRDVAVPAVGQETRRDNKSLSNSLRSLELQLAETRARLAATNNGSAVAKTTERTDKRHQRKLNKMAAAVRKLEDVASEQSKRLSEALQKISDLEQELAAANKNLRALTESNKNAAETGPSVVSIAKQLQTQSDKIDLVIGRLEGLQTQMHASSQTVAERPPTSVIGYESIAPEQLLEEIIKRREHDEATKRDFDKAMNRLKAIEKGFSDSSQQSDAVIEPTENEAEVLPTDQAVQR